MIHGTVVGLQARISVLVRLEDKSDVEIEFVIDTGFEGFLTLPPDLVAKLSLPYIAKIQANLADNSKTTTNAHAIKIVWERYGARSHRVGDGSSSSPGNCTTCRLSSQH